MWAQHVQVETAESAGNKSIRKVYAVVHHNRSLKTQKSPRLLLLKAASGNVTLGGFAIACLALFVDRLCDISVCNAGLEQGACQPGL